MKTVFVIGAGASKEIGMPTGYELKEDISKWLKVVKTAEHSCDYNCRTEDETINIALQCLINSEGGYYFQAADTISSGLPVEISIDNFLDKHRDNAAIVSCGKLAITRAILDAEQKSYLCFEPDRDSYNVKQGINADKVQKTWYIPCFQKITENCLPKNIPERLQDITFVIFNYDRCFEQFFWYALMKDYAIDEREAREIIAQMHIIHPYGSVGPFIIDSFGEVSSYHELVALSENIKTFTERTAQSCDDYIKITNA
ncbi:hypothetical protein, partial [Treponema endosymbiont of Eucomonympha sp.]|uniref:hypothetical protein n=1 Tax=Treponema endosymbiont of Eucomonympha sp. TaxID=1580831 RepID=UPI000B2D40C5